MKPTRRIKCPTCQKEGPWFEGKYGPFCSHRCKLVDLGKWFGEELRISGPLQPDHRPDAMALTEEAHPDPPGDGESDATQKRS